MDAIKGALGGGSGGGSEDKNKEQGGSSGGGFLDKLNSKAGGGKESEKDEDYVDKGTSSNMGIPSRPAHHLLIRKA